MSIIELKNFLIFIDFWQVNGTGNSSCFIGNFALRMEVQFMVTEGNKTKWMNVSKVLIIFSIWLHMVTILAG